MATERTELVLGRGELYFSPLDPDTTIGTSEIYIGNTPEFVTTKEVSSETVFDSFDGQKVPVEGPVLREIHRARFTTDHIDVGNLALWYGGAQTTVVQNRFDDLVESHVLIRGRYYQLGTTPQTPFGVRGVENVTMTIGGVPVSQPANFEVDKRNGRVRILPDAPNVQNGDTGTFIYERRDMSSALVLSQKMELFGSLRFVARNPVGPNKNFFYPIVKLTPTGDMDHKATGWQVMSFEVEAQRRNPMLEYVYIDEVQVVGMTITEYAIIVEGGITVSEFPYWEDRLDKITNTRIPSHNYHL